MSAASSILFHGPFGSDPRTAWYERLAEVLALREEVLILTPDADARSAVLREAHARHLPLAANHVQSWPGYAWTQVQQQWSRWAKSQGFDAKHAPIYLAFEQAQVVMDAVVRPMREAGHFDGWALAPAPLAAELLDVRSQAASAGLSPDALSTTVPDDSPVHGALAAFTERCRRFNLIDFAALVGFTDALAAPDAVVFAYRGDEWPPVALQMLSRWMDTSTTSIALADVHGSTRFRLGVDARFTTAWLDRWPETEVSLPARTSLGRLADELVRLTAEPEAKPAPAASTAFWGHLTDRKRPRLFRSLAGTVRSALNQGFAPDQIAVIAPYIDGATEVLLTDAFERPQIPLAFDRRQQRLTASTEVRALRTVCALLAPDTFATPHPDDLALTLHRLLPTLDPLRARLLADELFEPETGVLRNTAVLREKDQQRLTEQQHSAYNALLNRLRPLDAVALPDLLDTAQALFPASFHAATPIRSLHEAVDRFGSLADALDVPDRYRLQRFFNALDTGFLAPAVTSDTSGRIVAYSIDGFLRQDRAVGVQLWLDVQAPRWMPVPYASFMNRATLSASWPSAAAWEAEHERSWRHKQAIRRIRSLLDRCDEGVYACSHRDPNTTLTPTPFFRAIHALAEAKR
ncbi:MAG: hypothetical protein RhofKO_19730 [Rhodothermales bacterium]